MEFFIHLEEKKRLNAIHPDYLIWLGRAIRLWIIGESDGVRFREAQELLKLFNQVNTAQGLNQYNLLQLAARGKTHCYEVRHASKTDICKLNCGCRKRLTG